VRHGHEGRAHVDDVEELTGATPGIAYAAAALVGLFLLLGILVVLVSGPGVDVAAAADEDPTAPAESVSEEPPHLRVHLTVPRHVIPGHEQSVAVAVSKGDGGPLDPDADLLVSAVLRSSSQEGAGVVLLGATTWSTTVRALSREPIRLMALGEPRCGVPAAELTVRVRSVGEDGAVEVSRSIDGPPCDGPEVVAAPASVNLDVPVRYDPRWRETVARLLDPSAQAPRATRPAPRRSSPAPTTTATAEPKPEPTETAEPEPEPTKTAEPKPEPEPTESSKPKPKPEPTETAEPKPEPEPTESSKPKPEPPPVEDDASSSSSSAADGSDGKG
jgi:hypothetical protein